MTREKKAKPNTSSQMMCDAMIEDRDETQGNLGPVTLADFGLERWRLV